MNSYFLSFRVPQQLFGEGHPRKQQMRFYDFCWKWHAKEVHNYHFAMKRMKKLISLACLKMITYRLI